MFISFIPCLVTVAGRGNGRVGKEGPSAYPTLVRKKNRQQLNPKIRNVCVFKSLVKGRNVYFGTITSHPHFDLNQFNNLYQKLLLSTLDTLLLGFEKER